MIYCINFWTISSNRVIIQSLGLGRLEGWYLTSRYGEEINLITSSVVPFCVQRVTLLNQVGNSLQLFAQ